MNIGILGSGGVGQTIGSKLVSIGHAVKLGTRHPKKLDEWRSNTGPQGTVGSFAEAAAFGEIVFNCTSGGSSLEALRLAGEQNLNGKVLIDLANPLDFSQGMPPSLLVCNTDSLGEQIQRAFPRANVVKTLNTVNMQVMVDPTLLPGDHDLFVSGDDAGAKSQVVELLKEGFGWRSVIDLGDITTARVTEMLMPIRMRPMGVLETQRFNFKIVH